MFKPASFVVILKTVAIYQAIGSIYDLKVLRSKGSYKPLSSPEMGDIIDLVAFPLENCLVGRGRL